MNKLLLAYFCFQKFYDTWGRPFGDDKNCQKYPQFCTYELMQDSLTTAYSTFACMNLPSR